MFMRSDQKDFRTRDVRNKHLNIHVYFVDGSEMLMVCKCDAFGLLALTKLVTLSAL